MSSPSPIGRSAAPAAFAMLGPLRAVLAPRAGERVLEVGAGNGYYTLEIAAGVRPGGSVDILDAHPDQLATAMRAASERNVVNVSPTLGDSRYLPFEDRTFDGAYLVAALGDAADGVATLGELRRVLKPGGRIVVGELNGDPHRIAPAQLDLCAADVGLRVTRRIDGLLGYVARLEAAADRDAQA